MRISDWSSDVCSSDLPVTWCDTAIHIDTPVTTVAMPSATCPATTRTSPAASPCPPRRHSARKQQQRQRRRPGPPAMQDVDEEGIVGNRSEEHTSELQSLMRTSYAVFCLNKNTQ